MQIDLPETKTTPSKMENTLGGINSSLDRANRNTDEL